MSFESQYSRSERMLHDLAFGGIGLQKNVSEMEDMMFAKLLADVEPTSPVFVSSLPRAGTTLLLETLSKSGQFATHTYREMPFLFCPLLWSQISQGFRKEADLRERAHGDGMMVGFDSPEAFEEVFWRAYFPEKYKADRIEVWGPEDRDVQDEFETFFRSHARKLVALRRSQGAPDTGRYISKNNGNIARFAKLLSMDPDAAIVTPFREPLAHAQSLHRQHLNFTDIHQREAFTRRYMGSIGHLDFGANLKPIDFGHWLDQPTPPPTSLEFWLMYWIAAFETVRNQASDRLNLVSFERLCASPVEGLSRVAEAVGVSDKAFIAAEAAKYRRPTPAREATPPRDLLDRATALHESLLNDSIV